MWLNIKQNEDEWLDLRAGKVTGSEVSKVMAHYGKDFGDPAKKLAITIAVERITKKRAATNNYTNKHMDRGHEEEPIARMLYEEMYFTKVINGGFYDNGKTGCSPDGLIGNDGLIEIKSVITTTHYATIERGGFDPAYKWQLFFNLGESGRKWIDFISYCSSYPKATNLYVYRIEKSTIEKELEMIDSRLVLFENMIKEIKVKIREK